MEDSMTERMVATGTAQMRTWHILHTKCNLKKTDWKAKMYDFFKKKKYDKKATNSLLRT